MLFASRIDSLMEQIRQYSVPFHLWCIFDFDGRLDAQVLRRAVDCLVFRVPVLGCCFKSGFFVDSFVPLDNYDFNEVVHFKELSNITKIEEETNSILNTVLEVRKGPGLAVYSISCGNHTRLIVQLHHMLADGRSAVNIMVELAAIYTELKSTPDYRPRETLDTRRSLFQIVKGLSIKHWLLMGISMFIEQVLKAFVLPSSFAPFAMDKGAPMTGKLVEAKYSIFEIDEERLSGIRQWCKNKGAKVNDFLMTAIILSIHRWNQKEGAPMRKRVPLIFAADMRRRYRNSAGPVANFSTPHKFWMESRHITSFEGTAKRVKAKIDRMKKTGLGLDGIGMALMVAWIPAAVWRRLSRPIFKYLARYLLRATGLTNIGLIPYEAGRFGDIEAKRCSVIVPIFPVNNVLFAATTFKDRLTLNMGYDSAGLTDEAVCSFKELLQSTIDKALA